MSNDNVFINDAINKMFVIYNRSKDQPESVEYNSFMCSVLRMLLLIYGEELLICYENKNVEDFEKNILKYGYDKSLYDNFLEIFNKFYRTEVRKEAKAIKKKNKFFNLVQKHLIDMMLKRDSVKLVDSLTKNEFYNLLFTAKSNNFYRMSYALLVAYNPYEVYEYAKKQKLVG